MKSNRESFKARDTQFFQGTYIALYIYNIFRVKWLRFDEIYHSSMGILSLLIFAFDFFGSAVVVSHESSEWRYDENGSIFPIESLARKHVKFKLNLIGLL